MMVTVVTYPETGIHLQTRADALSHFQVALDAANQELSGVCTLIFADAYFPPYGTDEDPEKAPVHNLVLRMKHMGGEEPIDIFDLKALNEGFIKTCDDLKNEMVAKARQHIAAKQVSGILFSTSGSKFDVRRLDDSSTLSIDVHGYLRFANQRLAVKSNDFFYPIKAANLRCYTILRLMQREDGVIRLFDDYDLVRKNNRGAFIDPRKPYTLGLDQIAKSSVTNATIFEDAKSYQGQYLLFERDELTAPEKQELLQTLQQWPIP